MQLGIYNKALALNYKSPSQLARVLTENWFKTEMYCPCCLNEFLSVYGNNKKGYDFFCNKCNSQFQVKGSKKKFGGRIVDGEYHTMMSIINANASPNFLCMHYSSDEWIVKNLFMIPKFFFSSSCIEIRKPLSINARRAGWTGCNIILENIPWHGKIFIIRNEKVLEKEEVHEKYDKIQFLNSEMPSARGWTSDVLNCIEILKKEKGETFTLNDVYSFETRLKKLHPDNFHIKDKIRQQLQLLRDRKVIRFDSKGKYSLIE